MDMVYHLLLLMWNFSLIINILFFQVSNSQGKNSEVASDVKDQFCNEGWSPNEEGTVSKIKLQEEINSLKCQLEQQNALMRSFLTEEQISALKTKPTTCLLYTSRCV